MKTTEILKNQTPSRCMKRLAALNPVKRFLAVSIVTLLAASATLCAYALPPGPRGIATLAAIRNGGFETGDPTGWIITGVFDGGVTSAEASSGSYSLELGAWNYASQHLTVTKRFGSLTFKAKNNSSAGPAYAFVEYEDGSSSEIMFGEYWLTGGNWTDFELALDSTKRVIRVSFGVGESDPIYIDNVALM